MDDAERTADTDASALGSKPAKPVKPEKVKRRGPSRFTVLVLGLILGLVGGFMLPGLLPDPSPTCEEPQRVMWERTGDGSVSQTVETQAATADACEVEVVFRDPS